MFEQVLASDFFRLFCVPLITSILVVGVKLISKRETYFKIRKEDCAIGFDVFTTAIFLQLIGIVDLARSAQVLEKPTAPLTLAATFPAANRLAEFRSQIIDAVVGLVFLIVGLWILSTVVRYFGWKSETEMHTVVGVVVPIVCGVLSLIFVLASKA